jgi:hypothetical protein
MFKKEIQVFGDQTEELIARKVKIALEGAFNEAEEKAAQILHRNRPSFGDDDGAVQVAYERMMLAIDNARVEAGIERVYPGFAEKYLSEEKS